jgi:hypothetical protein
MQRNKLFVSILTLAWLLLPAMASPALAQAKQDKSSAGTATLRGLLEKSGYGYSKVSDGVWEIPATGKNVKEFGIRVTLVDDIILVIAKLADRQDLRSREPLLLKLMELNHHFDAVKLALSEEMLYARVDMHLRLLDDRELKYQ